jgi:hypothetical protein
MRSARFSKKNPSKDNSPSASRRLARAKGANRRASLSASDENEVRKWIETSGLERVGRIVAALADARGRQGRPDKLEIDLLLKVARLTLQQPERALHSVALEVAREAHATRKPFIALESLTTKLERDFGPRRHALFGIARSNNGAEHDPARVGASAPRSNGEYRVIFRLTELCPGAIDLFDWVVGYLKIFDPEQARRLKLLGRARVEPLLASAMHKLLGPESDSFPGRGFDRLGRMIAPEIENLWEERARNAKRPRKVGR